MTSILKVDTIQDQDGNNIINENAGTITIGKSGDTVQVASGAEFVGGGTQWQSSIVTGTTLSAVAGNGYWIDTTSNACTVTLPGSASVGDQIIFVDYKRTWNTNNVTIDQNSLNFQGYSTPNPVYDTDGQTVNIVYSGSTQGWIPTSDDDVTDEVPQPYSADFLVIAGGGGGGARHGGGGGAGGYRTSTQTVNPATVITVTVGDGGVGSIYDGTTAGQGSNSSISGSGLTTITSTGGGRGGDSGAGGSTGGNGGSGGGAGGDSVSGGSGNTPSTAPSQGNNGGSAGHGSPNYGAGGGGGAGATGGNGTTTAGGAGGAGTASSITGSSVTRAGGGGGCTYLGGTPGAGGSGGGGAGSIGAGTAGTVNTGGGGGGSDRTPSNSNGGAGGKGVVIISVPTASYSGTTSGSPTVTTSGTNTIMQFNGSGSYTT